ncbi:RNA polymerase sigma factor, partial [Paucihalobacter sp.]
MSQNLEDEITQLLKEGDQHALNLLYEHYSAALFGSIIKVTNNQELAEDALQETFVKVWRYADRYDSKKAKLFTWLFR